MHVKVLLVELKTCNFLKYFEKIQFFLEKRPMFRFKNVCADNDARFVKGAYINLNTLGTTAFFYRIFN